MADFYPVLSRAIAGLQDKSPETRRAVYDKAKAVLVAQLRGVTPPVAETEIARQRLALDEVIARIEREYAHLDVSEHGPEATLAPAVSPEPAWAPPQPGPRGAAESPQQGPPPQSEPTAPTEGFEPSQVAAETASAAAAPAETPAADRPRVEMSAGREKRTLPWRNLAVGGGVAAVIGCVALAAIYLNRDAPSPLQPPTGQQQTPQTAAGPKINERVGADTGAPAASPQPAPGPQTGARGGDIAVAQRAVLYIEPTDGSQAPRAVNGRVSWRVEAQNPGRGQPLETIVRADVEIPDAGLSLAFTIRRNFDAAFPASHIVGLRFQRSSDDGNGAVREAGVPQFKSEENERGAPLSAITSVLGENLFVSALSRVPVEVERNVELMRTRNWIDIPIRFTSGRRGIVAFEKGVSGDQRLAEGLRAWQ